MTTRAGFVAGATAAALAYAERVYAVPPPWAKKKRRRRFVDIAPAGDRATAAAAVRV